MKVLIVEDEVATSEVLYDEFSLHGADVVRAFNGAEAMQKVRSEKPDVVLLDLLLPKMDGFEVLKQMKTDMDLQHIPVVVLSNLGQDDDMREALKLGAASYFIKTQHQVKEIIHHVEQLLAGRNGSR